MHSAAIILGYLFDFLLKDPEAAWHPVRLIGRFIAWQERFYRQNLRLELAGGVLLALITPAAVFFVCAASIAALAALHWSIALLGEALLVWCAISPTALAGEAEKIEKLLAKGEIEPAKHALSMIVGRDTAPMDEAAIARATVETAAENSVDGLIAPLFYAALGGGPLAMAYRAVNTCDSMVGYRNTRYERFGKASARLDDVLNFLPARLSIILIAVAAFLMGLNGWQTAVIGIRDRLKHPSPNSAHGEAAFAGALGVRLGGPSYYGGILKEKPWLGDPVNEPSSPMIGKARTLLMVVAALSVCVAAAVTAAF